MSRAINRKFYLSDYRQIAGSKAAQCLAEMLNQDLVSDYEKHRIMGRLASCRFAINEISQVKNPGIREISLSLYRDYQYKSIDNRNYPEKIASFMKNVIFSYCKPHNKRA